MKKTEQDKLKACYSHWGECEVCIMTYETEILCVINSETDEHVYWKNIDRVPIEDIKVEDCIIYLK